MSNCSNDDNVINSDLSGNWKVIYYIENGTKITKEDKNTWPDYNNGDITTSFSELSGKGKGNISGKAVTNSFGGEYTVYENGTISIGPIHTTEMNEPEWTDLFRIGLAESYEIKNSKLILYYNDKKNNITFEQY